MTKANHTKTYIRGLILCNSPPSVFTTYSPKIPSIIPPLPSLEKRGMIHPLLLINGGLIRPLPFIKGGWEGLGD
jgi:hypothetical protein